jgi:hypothetical protein
MMSSYLLVTSTSCIISKQASHSLVLTIPIMELSKDLRNRGGAGYVEQIYILETVCSALQKISSIMTKEEDAW